jgi:peptide-methionine (S)-S-oxide reductase
VGMMMKIWRKNSVMVMGMLLALVWGGACSPQRPSPEDKPGNEPKAEGQAKAEAAKSDKLMVPDESKVPANAGYAVLAGGCFWCVEEVLQQLDGVTSVVSGYSGGTKEAANYEAVCSGKTDHAEAVKVTFDRDKVSFSQVLDTFWKLHDPTTVNRQGHDVGRQYRSAIFYQDEEQKVAAEASKKKLAESEVYPSAIVTLIVPLDKFYPAEDYHQNYARLNPNDPYIQQVLFPKLEKLHLKLPE